MRAQFALAVAVFAVVALHGQGTTPAGEWRAYHSDAAGSKYSPLSQISASNIDRLDVAWRIPAPDRGTQESNPAWRTGRYEDTPLMANGVLYTVSGLGMVTALDPATGQERWRNDPATYKSGPARGNMGFIQRGLAYWTDGTAQRLFVASHDAGLLSIDAATGTLDTSFGDRGRVDLTAGIRNVSATNFAGRRPVVAGSVVVVGSSITDLTPMRESPPGDLQAYDIRTGRRMWVFHTVPRKGEPGYESWLEGSADLTGGANVWAGMAYDPELDYLYAPTSTPSSDYYGGHRPGNNLFAESLLCIDAKTGKLVWHFQAVHHGLWDYDFGSQPVLGEIRQNGQRVPVVMQVSKQAFAYVFDRRDGKPIWPIVERPVAKSSTPREWTSPTQPFPTRPAAFDRQGATEDNLLDFTPALRKRALDQLRRFEHGPLFTPPSVKGTLTLPGVWGGANWGGAGFDPETGMLYVGSQTSPQIIGLAAGDPKKSNLMFNVTLGNGSDPELPRLMTLDGLPLFKPPYSRMTAIDMNTGDHRWMTPLGNGPRQHPLLQGLNVPPLGDVLSGPAPSVLVTKTLLFVNRTSTRQVAGAEAHNTLLYVFDKATGNLLRRVDVDGVVTGAAPMTYEHGGKQYIVLAAGSNISSELIALALRP